MAKPENGTDAPEVDRITIKFVAHFAKEYLDAFMAHGFSREEAFALTMEAVKSGFDQDSEHKIPSVK